MPSLRVEIVRLVDDSFPSFVECVLVDSAGVTHIIVEKVPVLGAEAAIAAGAYPAPFEIACCVKGEWADVTGRILVEVSTEKPWNVASTSGISSFVVLASQVGKYVPSSVHRVSGGGA